jgi:murein DD-endopeptidase MepM/ murein hydrolase activator NlpD
MPRTRTLAALTALAVLIVGAACTRGPLGRLTRPPSPHEAYAESLRSSALDQTALGQDWLRAATRALESPVEVTLPFRESGYFPPEAASATAYRFQLQRGRTLSVEAAFESLGQGRLFVDVFRVRTGEPPERVSSMPADAAAITVPIDEDAVYLLRVQPELLRGGRYSLVQRTLASLPFPVPGLTSQSVKSGFGVERDAGVRQHEGVDIFAKAGTPVTAVTNGTAQPSTNNLGGNVVWLRDASGRRTYYYAHLDRWALTGTTTVKAGEVLGYVGNTGNARTTAPHLHFGIYNRGAIDPLPFIAADDDMPIAPAIDLPLGTLARVSAARSTLRRGPAPDAPTLATLERGTVARVQAATSGRAVRVLLPDDSVGYLSRQTLTASYLPLRHRALPAGAVLRERPTDVAPAVLVLDDAAQGAVLGSFSGYDLVRTPALSGWVANPAPIR